MKKLINFDIYNFPSLPIYCILFHNKLSKNETNLLTRKVKDCS